MIAYTARGQAGYEGVSQRTTPAKMAHEQPVATRKCLQTHRGDVRHSISGCSASLGSLKFVRQTSQVKPEISPLHKWLVFDFTFIFSHVVLTNGRRIVGILF